MTPRAQPLMQLAAVLIAVLATACTGGEVKINGSPVVGTEVSIWTCDQTEFLTTTDGSGRYQFNPYDPNSPDFDTSNYIPTGPIAIEVNGPEGWSVTRRQHQYDEECPIDYNGSNQALPCKIQSIGLVPMTPIQVVIAMGEFLAFDCGMNVQEAEERALQAMATPPEAIEPNLDERSELSCLTECASSCSPHGWLGPEMLRGHLPGDLKSCMCACAEVSCGTSFSGFLLGGRPAVLTHQSPE